MEQGLRTAERQRPGGTITALAIVTGLLLLIRLWLDRHLEVMFDEAYYALWSKNLAWCYLDHPPMVALWIRASTWLFGDQEFGIRALGTLAAAAGGPLVYLVSLRLFENRSEAAFAGLLYCSMLLIAAGAIIITPDTPLLFFWSIAIYAVIRIYRDADWRWWVVAGAAMGFALQSKYTALLLGSGIVSSMLFVPAMRRWWRHPAPYAASVVALAIFAPVIEWNYEHGWVSFAKQFGRARWYDFSLRYVGEFLGSQIGLLTPFVFVLAAGGVWMSLRGAPAKSSEPSVLLVSLIGPMLVYFLFHSLHARVEGNWLAPAYPVLAVLAAHAASRVDELHGPLRSVMVFSRQCALPVGFAFAGIAYLQAFVGLLPLNPAKDPTALMVGWSGLARDVDDVARREQASYVLTSSYGLTSLLSIYSYDAMPIIQFNERIRWISFEQPHAALFLHPGLYVSETNKDKSDELKRRFSEVKLVGSAVRLRGTEVIKRYVIYRLAQPVSPVLDAASTP
jgi:4-amino-4-deoxy-L-arabinose transferase-like glycosyltransferase